MNKLARQLNTFLTVFLLVSVTLQFSPVVHAVAPLSYAGFETNNLTGPTACGSISCKWWYTNWNNINTNFRIPLQGASSYRTVWISTSQHNEGAKSLGVHLMTPPTPTTNPWNLDPNWEKQRVEFEISNSTYFTQHLDDSRYYGFAMYIHPDTPALQKGAIFSQVWQSTSPGKHPPFSLRFQDNTNYKWSVKVSVDSATDPDGYEYSIYDSDYELARGVWHEFIVRFRPSATNQGAVQVWHNNTLRANISQSSGQDIGYAPDTSPIVNDSFATRVGAYRQPEPNITTDIILFFDQIKFGLAKDDVDP